MRLNGRLLVLLVVFGSALCDNKKVTNRGGRHFLALLGYLHGYKIGQDYAIRYPNMYLIAPLIVLPSVNQQQSVNIQSGSTDDNYQENGSIFQSIAPAKIIKGISKEEITETNTLNDNDIEIPRTVRSNIEEASLRQSVINGNNTVSVNVTEVIEVLTNNNTVNSTTMPPGFNKTTGGPYPYPLANYDSQMINSISLTTDSPSLGQGQDLPPITDNRWQNFTLKSNPGDIMSDDNTTTMMNEIQNNTVTPPFWSENMTKFPGETAIEGPYPNSWYNSAAIDQLSITNHYKNESPFPQNDRWGSNSQMNKITMPSGFRPLAGLYYDGFLHRPLKKFGFIPQNYWN